MFYSDDPEIMDEYRKNTAKWHHGKMYCGRCGKLREVFMSDPHRCYECYISDNETNFRS